MLRKAESFFPIPGLKEEWFTDDEGNLHVVKSQDLDPVMANIKAAREAPIGKELKPAAEIPIAVLEEYMNKRGYNPLIHDHHDQMRMLQDMLNDPDYAHFRIWSGRVGRHK